MNEMESIFYQKQKLNVKAAEFIPRHVLEKIREGKLFDKLEKQFVEDNKWIFEYEPLADVVVSEQEEHKSQVSKRKFHDVDTDSEETEESDDEQSEQSDMDMDLQGSDVESVYSTAESMMSIDTESLSPDSESDSESSPTWADIVKGTSPTSKTCLD